MIPKSESSCILLKLMDGNSLEHLFLHFFLSKNFKRIDAELNLPYF